MWRVVATEPQWHLSPAWRPCDAELAMAVATGQPQHRGSEWPSINSLIHFYKVYKSFHNNLDTVEEWLSLLFLKALWPMVQYIVWCLHTRAPLCGPALPSQPSPLCLSSEPPVQGPVFTAWLGLTSVEMWAARSEHHIFCDQPLTFNYLWPGGVSWHMVPVIRDTRDIPWTPGDHVPLSEWVLWQQVMVIRMWWVN